MNYQRMWSFAVASVLTLSSAAAAQQQAEKITFQQAIELALKQNLDVRRAENALELADISVSQSRASYQPDFRLGLSGSNNFGRSFDQTTGTIANENKQSAGSQLSSGYTLYDPARSSNVASNKAALVASEADVTRSRQTAAYTVAVNFVAYVSARSRVEVQRENLTAFQLQESQVQRFADAGARPISDLYVVKSNVANAQLSLTQAEQQVENAKFTLMQTLQLDPAKDYDFVPPVIPDSLMTTPYNLDSLVNVAYSRRGDLNSAKGRLLSAEKRVSAAGAGRRPTLSMSASYGSSGRFSDPATPAGPGTWYQQFERNRSGSVSMSVGFPILDRGNVSLNRRSADIQRENAELSLSQTRQVVALDVRRAWFNIRSAQQQLISAQAALVSAAQALESMQQRYNVGAATLLEVTQARASRVNAQSALNDARFNLVLNQAAMQYFTGELDPVTLRVGR